MLVHQYRAINAPRLWIIIEHDIPDLSNFVHKNLMP
ncbi:HepT-like ribonuclease domain-containing protein [Methanospirillum hungatei]